MPAPDLRTFLFQEQTQPGVNRIFLTPAAPATRRIDPGKRDKALFNSSRNQYFTLKLIPKNK